MATSEAFREARERSRVIEMAFSAWLKRRRYKVVPTYDYSGLQDDKAPKMEAADPTASLVLPDLLAARDGRIFWFEVKLKTEATWTRCTQRYETGISFRLWQHYWQVQHESGGTVHLIFVHEKEREVRCGTLAELDDIKRPYFGSRMGRAGMVFFPCEKLHRIASLDELGL